MELSILRIAVLLTVLVFCILNAVVFAKDAGSAMNKAAIPINTGEKLAGKTGTDVSDVGQALNAEKTPSSPVEKPAEKTGSDFASEAQPPASETKSPSPEGEKATDRRQPYLISLHNKATDKHFEDLNLWLNNKNINITESINEVYIKFLVANMTHLEGR